MYIIQVIQSFNYCLTLDMAVFKAPLDTPIRYSVVILAKGMCSDHCQIVGIIEVIILPSNKIDINVRANGLTYDIFRLDAVV